MKIYLASSWKNKKVVIDLARILREDGHKVDCFCEENGKRFVFNGNNICNINETDAIEFMGYPETKRVYKEDRSWIDWSDAVIMVLPCGNSAHLEAGYGKGKSKILFIYGCFDKGKVDAMYGFADEMFRTTELTMMRDELKYLDKLLNILN